MTKTPLAIVFAAAALVACGPTLVQGPDSGKEDGGVTPVDPGEDGPAYEGEDDALPGEDDGDSKEQALSAGGATCASNAHTGDYCGGDKVTHGNSDALYSCHGPGAASVVKACADGCHVAPAGEDDFCNAPPPPTCDANAHSGEYCGGDKVSHGHANVLYRCDGPGSADVVETCNESCVVAPAGHDDYCEAGGGTCAHHSQLRWGLAPVQSDHLRCAGITSSSDISQTIGNAAASAGTHAQDGTIDGFAYCAATDLRTAGMSNAQVRALLSDLADQGFAAFFRNPGHDGWPSSEIRHIHAIYVGVPMKSSLRSQVQDWLNGKNGLVSHSTYTFWQASHAQKNAIQSLFNAHN
ncbi:MAG TPA: hypothetical protein VGO62_16715 [Myxococcota bacterium]|jgi:hypothetical protein